MDNIQLQKWVKELKISPVEIIREETEMFILNSISQSYIGKMLIFKGGTALRLCYGSPRFSQDLDFNQRGPVNFNDFKELINDIASKRTDISIKDVYNKRFTIFALMLVRSPLLKQSFSIKIEVSKKNYGILKENKDYSLIISRSPVSLFNPLLYVYSLERIFLEKEMAIKSRQQPRDYFDLEFVAQKLERSIKIPKPTINPSRFKGELNQLLPNNLKDWAANFLKRYERS